MHIAAENKIYAVQNVFMRAVIGVKIHNAVALAVAGGILLHFIKKQCGLRIAETVYALLYIPHHKKIILPKPFL